MLRTRLAQTNSKLDTKDVNQIRTLTDEKLAGDIHAIVISSYFSYLEIFGRASQTRANIVDNPGLRYGFFYSLAIPKKSYGVTSAVSFPGVMMDVGHVRRFSYSKSNNQTEWVIYNRLKGQHASAMEHAIPEAFLDDPHAVINENPPTANGVSVIKALAIAESQGQKIYTH